MSARCSSIAAALALGLFTLPALAADFQPSELLKIATPLRLTAGLL